MMRLIIIAIVGPTATPLIRPRAILFDAGNTLVQMDYAAIAQYLAGRGRPASAARVEEAEVWARVQLDRDLASGASTESGDTHGRYLRYVLSRLGITEEDEIDAIARWRRDYNHPVGLWNCAEPTAAGALGRVKAAGLIAGVISNSNGSVRSLLEDIGLARHLDFIIDSAVVGVEKPDPRIFRLALEHAGVPAEAAVYVGDLYSVDVLGARGAGLGAVLLDPLGYWGARDCPVARGLEEAIHLCLGGGPGL
ncbi:MAG TPA: HAD-IA family hydrolase [Methylomirabilota bacterium]|jgi:putative hydrolase of the HAD superfamily|nr:HAD-IA family hydrolase [Methylomirabilota bacterium]